jgi:hypothetical protein
VESSIAIAKMVRVKLVLCFEILYAIIKGNEMLSDTTEKVRITHKQQ